MSLRWSLDDDRIRRWNFRDENRAGRDRMTGVSDYLPFMSHI